MPKDYVTIKQFNEFRDEMLEFKEAVFKLYSNQENEYVRRMGAWAEDMRDEIKGVAEALKMQIEKSEREWMEHQKEHSILNFKIAKLESVTI